MEDVLCARSGKSYLVFTLFEMFVFEWRAYYVPDLVLTQSLQCLVLDGGRSVC